MASLAKSFVVLCACLIAVAGCGTSGTPWPNKNGVPGYSAAELGLSRVVSNGKAVGDVCPMGGFSSLLSQSGMSTRFGTGEQELSAHVTNEVDASEHLGVSCDILFSGGSDGRIFFLAYPMLDPEEMSNWGNKYEAMASFTGPTSDKGGSLYLAAMSEEEDDEQATPTCAAFWVAPGSTMVLATELKGGFSVDDCNTALHRILPGMLSALAAHK